MIQIFQDSSAMAGANLTITYGFCDFYFGRLLIAESEKGICRLSLAKDITILQDTWPFAALIEDNARAAEIKKDLLAVWQGEGDIKVHLQGTDFQLSVWQALSEIPSGETVSYEDIAVKIGSPRAVRAVGTAVGQNPVPILIPCHRIVRKDGSIGEFSLGGAEVKRQLLAAEGVSL